MPDEWIGIVQTTIPKYMKGASDLTKRGRLLLATLNKKGRYEYNQSGTECRWQVKFSQPQMESYSGTGAIDFENHDAYRQLVMPWRGYILRDSISYKQELMNSGTQALVNLAGNKIGNLTQSARDNLNGEMFKSGDATGRTDCIHGLETFLTAGTTVVGDIAGKPDDSYGGFDTDVAAQGGSWSAALTTKPNASIATDWPYGSGESEYDFNSPKLTNWSSNAWGTGSVTWEANCWRSLVTTNGWLSLTGGPDGVPDLCPLASNLWDGLIRYMEVKQREIVPHKESTDLGFGNTVNVNGMSVYPEFDCPIDTFYQLNCSKITISCMTPELLWAKGPTEDIRSGGAKLFLVGFFGNAKYQPKFVGKGKNYAAS